MPDPLANAYPDLAHLLGAYLHQDFAVCHGTLEGAVAALGEDDGPEAVAATRRDIRRLLLDHPTDTDAALHRVEASHARPPGMEARRFLMWLDGVLARTAPARGDAAE